MLELFIVQCLNAQENASYVSKFLEHYVNSNVHSLFKTEAKPVFRNNPKVSIKQAILNKISELKPFLEDDDYRYSLKKYELGDTEILESSHIERKGKSNDVIGSQSPHKIKENINEALDKESVSRETKTLVAKALDELVARVVGSQCRWKSTNTAQKVFGTEENELKSFFRAHNLTVKGWKKLQSFLTKLLMNGPVKPSTLYKEVKGFFEKITNDITTKKYTIRCRLIEQEDEKRDILRDKDFFRERRKEYECRYFQICSKELYEYLMHFYNTINSTIVNTINNYAAMYYKDANNENESTIEKVSKVLKDFSGKVENKIRIIFTKELDNLSLDKNKHKNENIKIVRDFINKTIRRTGKHVEEHAFKHLKHINVKSIILNVKKDLECNINADLMNIETELKTNICIQFSSCNENTRRFQIIPRNNLLESKNKKVYVNLKSSSENEIVNSTTENYRKKIDYENDKKYIEAFKNVIVTRTTTRLQQKNP